MAADAAHHAPGIALVPARLGHRDMRRPSTLLTAVMALVVAALAIGVRQIGWADLWMTPDQRGRRLMAEQNYQGAAGAFADPMWAGVARFRASEFKEAAETFGGLGTRGGGLRSGKCAGDVGQVRRCRRPLRSRPRITAGLGRR